VKWYTAQDTFHVDLPSGGGRAVAKGTTLPETDEVVQLVGEGALFVLQDTGEEPAAKPARAPRAAKS
jgi:hypothetical protein